MLGDFTQAALDTAYATSFGRAAGYLPKNRQAVSSWLADLAERAQDRKDELSPSVAALGQLLQADKIVQALVTTAFDQLPKALQRIRGTDHLLKCLDEIVTTAPEYRANPDERILFPLSALFAGLSPTPAGTKVLQIPVFNAALQQILKAWCVFLDSPASRYVLTEAGNGWLSPHAVEQNKLTDYVIPDRTAEYWGFASFNDFFHRKIKPAARPLATDAKAVVAPGDGIVVRRERNVRKAAGISLKGQTYALTDLLNNNSTYTDRFVGGDVFQMVLPAMGYHRWHSPVDGVVRHVETVPGVVFGAADPVGAAATSTRGLVFIESSAPQGGMVCLVPVGISEVSSITITAAEGRQVKKGEELGYFQFGGSSMCLVFEPNKVEFTVPTGAPGAVTDDGAPIFVNSAIARAK